jgi:hypothetical protein
LTINAIKTALSLVAALSGLTRNSLVAFVTFLAAHTGNAIKSRHPLLALLTGCSRLARISFFTSFTTRANLTSDPL